MTKPKDTDVDALIDTFYRALDNRGTQAPSGVALRALFAVDARIRRVAAGSVEHWTVDEFIEPRIAMLTNGTLTDFHEWETRSTTAVFDRIASRESHYQKTGSLHGAPYSGGGRKFIQLCRLNESWCICAILWEDD